jgi:hydrogenase expression/formation protein HypD
MSEPTASLADARREAAIRQLKFRDPALARRLSDSIARVTREIGRAPVSVMHVCGSHEQAIAKFGLRATFPRDLNVIMGPGCPVCITDMPEVDEGVALARQGHVIASYGDMLKVRGTVMSLNDAQAEGASVEVVYSASQAVDLARATDRQVVFFATGFETTAVATAAVVRGDPPPNFSVLSAHKYIPPVMEIVAEMPDTRVEGFLAAGHAATITGWGIFEPFVERHRLPVVVAGFEPLDILAGLARLVELVRDREASVVNMFPRCVTKEGNKRAQEELWSVFRPVGGRWRGIAHIPNGNLRLRDEWARLDARRRFDIDLSSLWDYAPPTLAADCICGDIMSGIASPSNCKLFGKECVPDTPVGACMVSSEGTCKIWHQYGGHPDLGAL